MYDQRVGPPRRSSEHLKQHHGIIGCDVRAVPFVPVGEHLYFVHH